MKELSALMHEFTEAVGIRPIQQNYLYQLMQMFDEDERMKMGAWMILRSLRF